MEHCNFAVLFSPVVSPSIVNDPSPGRVDKDQHETLENRGIGCLMAAKPPAALRVHFVELLSESVDNQEKSPLSLMGRKYKRGSTFRMTRCNRL